MVIGSRFETRSSRASLVPVLSSDGIVGGWTESRRQAGYAKRSVYFRTLSSQGNLLIKIIIDQPAILQT